MPRKPYDEEAQIRNTVDMLLSDWAKQTKSMTFARPSALISKLKSDYGITASKELVIARYRANGIEYHEGFDLWLRDL